MPRCGGSTQAPPFSLPHKSAARCSGGGPTVQSGILGRRYRADAAPAAVGPGIGTDGAYRLLPSMADINRD